MTILVTGATGTVGRQVVGHLLDAGEHVRALTRDPSRAQLPDGVEVVPGDLDDASSLTPVLRGVTAAHLICFGSSGVLTNGAELVTQLQRADVQRCTVLTDWDESTLQPALTAAGMAWTHLCPVAFMANALEDLAPSIRDEGLIRVAGELPGADVHESDIGAVAAAALTGDGHAGQTYLLTGPQALTTADKLRIIGEVIGRDLSLVVMTPDEARARWRAEGHSEEMLTFMLELELSPPDVGSQVQPTVQEVTGRPALTFADWAETHADAFRAGTTA